MARVVGRRAENKKEKDKLESEEEIEYSIGKNHKYEMIYGPIIYTYILK